MKFCEGTSAVSLLLPLCFQLRVWRAFSVPSRTRIQRALCKDPGGVPVKHPDIRIGLDHFEPPNPLS
jgi:hypothetical protein